MRKLNKKGFTLVELIVVIAIIGVLAAILVPTLLGYVHSSRITSADRTAADLRKHIGFFLTDADAAGYGMRSAKNLHTEFVIEVVDYEWSITVSDVTIFSDKNMEWKGSGKASALTPAANADCAETLLCQKLANLFPEIKNAYMGALIHNGSCAAFYASTETPYSVTVPAFDDDGWAVERFLWNGDTEGVCEEGFVVGTSPKVVYGD